MNSKTCPDCLRAAADAYWGGYHSQCPGCDIRAIAQAPKQIRELRYNQITRALGKEAGEEIRRCVREEYARIKGLKGCA